MAKFEKGNKIGPRFGAGTDPREAQKKGVESRNAATNRMQALIAHIGVDAITAAEIDKRDRLLLSMTQEQLLEAAQDKLLPADFRRRARLLVGDKSDKNAVEFSEKIRDRAFGKPMQKAEMELKNDRPINVVDFTKK